MFYTTALKVYIIRSFVMICFSGDIGIYEKNVKKRKEILSHQQTL